ncbi:MAG: flagellar basal body L-ring protein FlgH [Pyrinomonadaceae bacterium]|nr:flagellar basal body L-ring protein FlgH [Phycisphaerales bacterium]
MKTITAASLIMLSLTAPCFGQSLNERDPAKTPVRATVAVARPVDPAAALQGVSLIAVTPPPPKTYQKNDLIEIIINESSLQKHQQSLDTKKDYTTKAELSKFPSLHDLIELQLRNPENQSKANLELGSNNKFKGSGQYERKDNFTARITATILEVKPNGTLVLEARKSFTSNKEETALVMSGLCRPDDVTLQNTIQSSQLANLSLTVKNEGDVNDASKKGFIPQVLDTIFNF